MAVSPFNHPIVKEILELAKPLWAIDYSLGLLGWDRETYMPPKGVEARSHAVAELSVLRRRLLLSDKLVNLVEKAENAIEELNDFERGVVRVLSREIRIAKALPEDFIARFSRTVTVATKVWAEAKRSNDFEKFKPYLDEIIKLNIERAERLGYMEHPYDALLDLYEEGWTTRDVEAMFNELLPAVRRIYEKVLSEGFYPREHELERVEYDIGKARKLMETVLTRLGWDWERGRLDTSAHPFTMGLDVDDVRITTRYEGRDIRRPLYAVIHEFGHALYELQVDKAIARTPIGGGVSLGVHESQSRFWENIVGRSPWFVKALKPVLDEHLGFTAKYDWLELYRYFNIVRPELIRVEADELTYNLHIYLRFELEKRMVSGELGADAVAEEWDNMMEKLLGVRPKTVSEGVLQDIHWSMGSMGYFPTYSLGNVIAAQVRAALLKEYAGFIEDVGKLEFARLREWLRARIHRWGKTYPPKELITKATGEPPTPRYLVEYLEWKYLKLPDELG